MTEEVQEVFGFEDAVSRMYGEDSEPEITEPTDEVEEQVSEEIEDDQETDDEDSASGQESEEEESGDDDELVFDEANEFVKYEFDEESGLYQFKSEGKKVKANIEKLISSFNQNQNYTKDKMKLAEERKGIFEEAKNKELEAVRTEAAKYQELTAKLESLVTEKQDEIDWDELRQYDTAEYLKQKELLKERQDTLAKAREDQAKQQSEQRKQLIERETKSMLEAMPEWKDEEVKKKDLELITEGLDTLGFSKEEAANIVDHRAYKAILLAAKFLKASDKAKQSKEVKKIPQSVKSKKTGLPPKELSPEELFYGKGN